MAFRVAPCGLSFPLYGTCDKPVDPQSITHLGGADEAALRTTVETWGRFLGARASRPLERWWACGPLAGGTPALPGATIPAQRQGTRRPGSNSRALMNPSSMTLQRLGAVARYGETRSLRDSGDRFPDHDRLSRERRWCLDLFVSMASFPLSWESRG